MSCCDVKGLMPLSDALEKMQESLSNVCDKIVLPLSDALGFTLCENIISDKNVPPFNNSAMDGYALHANDLKECSIANPIQLTQVGKSFAGVPFKGEVEAVAVFEL